MSTSVPLYPRTAGVDAPATNPFPELIQTPTGLAILELQGTINLPQMDESGGEINTSELPIGRIVFPDYRPDALDPSSTAWMKRVHLYVGQHQRLTGEVKKLPRAMAIIRKKQQQPDQDIAMEDSGSAPIKEELEVVEIVKHKLVFSQRPEPVGSG